MYDARIFLDTLDSAKEILKVSGAVLKGEYEIHDYIFSSTDSNQTLDKIFLRLRIIPKNIWNEKMCIVAIKNTEIQNVGKKSLIPIKEQFDTEVEGRAFIDTHYSDTFRPDFDFNRIGWQYDIPNGDQVDLEVIEGHPSIEFKSNTEEGLHALLTMFNVVPEQIIKGPSVVTIKNLLKF